MTFVKRVAADGALARRPRGAPPSPTRRCVTPTRAATLVLAVAVHALPAGHRERYRREFCAELVDMSPIRQLGYAVALLQHSTALALALRGQDPARRRHPDGGWRCRAHLHRDVARPVGGVPRPGLSDYRQCTRCGRVASTRAGEPPALGYGVAAPDAG